MFVSPRSAAHILDAHRCVITNRRWSAEKIAEVAGTRPIQYVGRPTPFGNPFTVENFGREKALELYSTYLQLALETNKPFRQLVYNLWGKALACWCAPAPCHADLLAEAAERLHLKEEKSGSTN